MRHPPQHHDRDRTTHDYDQIRTNLVARGALTGPRHWDELVRECRADATSAEDLIEKLKAKAATLPGSHDRITHRDSSPG